MAVLGWSSCGGKSHLKNPSEGKWKKSMLPGARTRSASRLELIPRSDEAGALIKSRRHHEYGGSDDGKVSLTSCDENVGIGGH